MFQSFIVGIHTQNLVLLRIILLFEVFWSIHLHGTWLILLELPYLLREEPRGLAVFPLVEILANLVGLSHYFLRLYVGGLGDLFPDHDLGDVRFKLSLIAVVDLGLESEVLVLDRVDFLSGHRH